MVNIIPTIKATIALIFSFPGTLIIRVSVGTKKATIPRIIKMIPKPNTVDIIVSRFSD